MSQDPVDDVLILDAAVRRIADDFDGSTAETANLDVDADGRPINTRLSRFRSAGERTSVLVVRVTHFPRLAGETSPRHRCFGASTPW